MAIALAAGGLFPAMFAAVWWGRANAIGAVAGMLAGFAATAAVIVAFRNPDLATVGTPDPRSLDLSVLSAGIVGLPVGFIVIAVVSALSPRPSADRQAVIDAIRRPGGRPFLHQGEG
jgi:cation/acetate symporter